MSLESEGRTSDSSSCSRYVDWHHEGKEKHRWEIVSLEALYLDIIICEARL